MAQDFKRQNCIDFETQTGLFWEDLKNDFNHVVQLKK